MASSSETPTTMDQLLRKMQRDIIALQRRRPGDGVNIDGQCEFGGGSGGDTSYYGGGTNYPDGSFPDTGWASDGVYTEGANIDIEGNVIHFAVDMSEPGSPRTGQVWLGP